jgi:magnesium transporter
MKRPNYLLHPLRSLLGRAHRPPPGSSPGLLRSEPGAPPPRITLLAYGPDSLAESEVSGPEALAGVRGTAPVVWINVDGVGHAETVRVLGETFGLHRLALEDVMNVPQRAKVEDYGEYLFIVARMARVHEAVLDTEQIGIFLGPDFVVTFQERPGDPLDPVRERIRNRVGRIRSSGADYLAYAVLDAITDHYFPVLEELGDRLDDMEAEILRGPSRTVMTRLYGLKRDLTSSLTDLYLSLVGQRTNEIMKVLTIFAAIFIPLTFIAGIYGMNFDYEASPFNMPELHWFWGYPFALGLMLAVAVGMLFYFYRKGWIGEGS